jgi:hypothetical protein
VRIAVEHRRCHLSSAVADLPSEVGADRNDTVRTLATKSPFLEIEFVVETKMPARRQRI